MLTAGILIMVASIVVGVLALTLVAVMSPGARSAARRTRTAMGLSRPDADAPDYGPAGEGVVYYEDEEPPPPAGQGVPAVASVAEPVAEWVIVLVVGAGAGLMLGLLMVMIASIP